MWWASVRAGSSLVTGRIGRYHPQFPDRLVHWTYVTRTWTAAPRHPRADGTDQVLSDERTGRVPGLSTGIHFAQPPEADMQGIPDDDALLTPSEVAAMFRVNPKTVTRWARAGKISAIRTLGGHRRFRASEIRQFLEKVEEHQDL